MIVIDHFCCIDDQSNVVIACCLFVVVVEHIACFYDQYNVVGCINHQRSVS
jgi:hypothetical protein